MKSNRRQMGNGYEATNRSVTAGADSKATKEEAQNRLPSTTAGREIYDRSTDAGRIAKAQAQESETRSIRANRPAPDGGDGVNDRTYAAGLDNAEAKDADTILQMNNTRHDPGRAAAERAKTNADRATKDADTRTENSAGMLQVRASNKVSTEGLEKAKNATNTSINRAAAGETVAGINAATSTQLMDSAEQIETSKTDLKTSEQDMSNRVEGVDSVIESKVVNASSAGRLENTQEATKTVIADLGTAARPGVTLTGAAARIATANPGVRAQLQSNVIEHTASTSATSAAVNQQNQDVAEALIAAGAELPGGVAYEAAGISGDQGVARVQAKATSAQAQFRTENVNAAATLFNAGGYQTGDDPANPDGELIRIAMGGPTRSGPSTSEQQEAAMQMVHSTGSYKGMREMFNYTAGMPTTTVEQRQEKQRMQQALNRLYVSNKPKSVGGAGMGMLAAGTLEPIVTTVPGYINVPGYTPMQNQVVNAIKGGKFAAETFVSTDKDEMDDMAAILADPAAVSLIPPAAIDKFGTELTSALTDTLVRKGIKPEQKDRMDRMLASLGLPAVP
jgi:hypothetical protein